MQQKKTIRGLLKLGKSETKMPKKRKALTKCFWGTRVGIEKEVELLKRILNGELIMNIKMRNEIRLYPAEAVHSITLIRDI